MEESCEYKHVEPYPTIVDIFKGNLASVPEDVIPKGRSYFIVCPHSKIYKHHVVLTIYPK